ncbi:glycosyltransferase family 4 protein [Fulvivirga sediminis]|uniref:Glycosyltransferase family 4 protein n=1 Tax=Fulvivirga sediminis TaxID=2803949 RepID=A0A937JY01_9BACT|nr:glycosyltransferase family 4 protein [Fulvivirga sediminis]MBL3655973.1 glycosyltransferase family 4 protein [Fulvivirga sediminis]
MDELKVLMLGPGEPTALNSGLGIATHHIAKNLNSLVKLTIIQPGDSMEETHHSEVTGVNFQQFNEINVAKDMARISIKANLAPYFYSGYTSEMPAKEKMSESEVKKELELFTSKTISFSKHIDFDLIYSHDWTTMNAAMEIKKNSKKPLVVHIHSLDYDRSATHGESWVYELEKEGLEAADRIIAVSEYSAQIINEFYHIPTQKIDIVHNAIEAYRHSRVNKIFTEKLILFVGRLTGQKGPALFMQIAAKVNQQIPETRFVMAGTGELLKQLIESGAYRSVSGKFHFTGQLSPKDMKALYRRCDIYCMPSVSEPFGLSALEAASMGLPVVISKQSGAAEILPAALKADYWDIDLFVKHIVSLLTSERLYNEVVEKNTKEIGKLSWEEVAESIVTVFNKVKA